MITADQVRKLFNPTGLDTAPEYQVDFDCGEEGYFSVFINGEIACFVSTGVWDKFYTKQKSFLRDRKGNLIEDFKVRQQKVYEWIAKELNKKLCEYDGHFNPNDDLAAYSITRNKVRWDWSKKKGRAKS